MIATRRRQFSWAALAMGLCLVGTRCRSDNEALPVVVFAFTSHPADTLRVAVSDPATVQAASAYITSGRGAHIPNGIIVHGSGVDRRYPFHFLPETVQLVEFAIELCDGAPMHSRAEVEQFMQGAGGSGGQVRWCPWSAYPIRIE